MRAILIDPTARTVTEVEHDATIENIYRHIGADCFCTVNLGNGGDAIFLDDEGLFREGQDFFAIGSYPSPLAGKGLILGCDAEGETIAPTISRAIVARAVRWLSPQQAVQMNNHAAAAAHAHAAIGNAADKGTFHVVHAPLLVLDEDTGKARGA